MALLAQSVATEKHKGRGKPFHHKRPKQAVKYQDVAS